MLQETNFISVVCKTGATPVSSAAYLTERQIGCTVCDKEFNITNRELLKLRRVISPGTVFYAIIRSNHIFV